MRHLLFKSPCWTGGCSDSNSPAESTKSSGIHRTCVDGSKHSSEQNVSNDGNLEQSDIQLRLVMHHGLSTSCCCIAFDPLQHMLAVATNEGYIKVFNNEGMESFLQSSRQCAIKFLQFVNNQNILICANQDNFIEVWDISSLSLIGSQAWSLTISTLAVIQDSSYFYIGDSSGSVTVLQHDREQLEVNVTLYVVSLPQIIGNSLKNYSGDLSVKDILPQPNAEHERVLICYENGICALWALFDGEVVSIHFCTPSELEGLFQISKQKDHTIQQHSSDLNTGWQDQDTKQFTSVCWCCERGIIFATGYSDGEIWLWSIAQLPPKSTNTKEQFISKCSSTPMSKIKTGFSVPINVLRWWEKGARKQEKEKLLCALGGNNAAANDMFKVICLNNSCLSRPKEYLRLEVLSPIVDYLLAESMAWFSLDAEFPIVAVGTDGKFYAYTDKEVQESCKILSHKEEVQLIRPISVENTFCRSKVTTTKLCLLKKCGHVPDYLLQAPRSFKPYVSSQSLGLNNTSFSLGCKETNLDAEGCYLYFTGHANGFVHVWDLSSQMTSVCSLQPQTNGPDVMSSSGNYSVTALDFCLIMGLLAVGYANGLISLFQSNPKNRDVHITKPSYRGDDSKSIGWSNFGAFYTHQAPISCVVISAPWHQVAVGCVNGQISIIDIDSKTIVFNSTSLHDKLSSITSVHFAYVTMQQQHTISFCGTISFSKKKHSARMRTERVFVTTKQSEVLVLDSQSCGSFKTSFKIQIPSTLISMHIVDALGISLTPAGYTSQLLTGGNSLKGQKAMLESEELMKMTTTLGTAQDAYLLDHTLSGEQSGGRIKTTDYVLLFCSEDALRVHHILSPSKDISSSSMKIKLDCSCHWATTFQSFNQKTGFAILYKTGKLELRCLPSLNILKSIAAEGILCCNTGPTVTSLRHISCTINGCIAVVKDDGVVLVLSVLSKKHEFRCSKLLPTNSEAVTKGTEVSNRKMKKRTLKKIIKATNVLLRASDKGNNFTCQTAVDLDMLFTGRSSSLSVSFQSSHPFNDELPTAVDIRSNSLDIDDIELEDEDSSTKDRGEALRLYDSSTKVKMMMKQKEKLLQLDSSKIKLYELENVKQVPKSEVDLSNVHGSRTSDKIRAAYGQGKESSVTGEAAALRDKMIQQRRKTQAIEKKTADMQEGAQQFNKMAEELLRAVEEKNKRKFF